MRFYQDMTHPSWSPESLVTSRHRRCGTGGMGVVILVAILIAVVVVVGAVVGGAVAAAVSRHQDKQGNTTGRNQQSVGAESPDDPVLIPTVSPTKRTANLSSPVMTASSVSSSPPPSSSSVKQHPTAPSALRTTRSPIRGAPALAPVGTVAAAPSTAPSVTVPPTTSTTPLSSSPALPYSSPTTTTTTTNPTVPLPPLNDASSQPSDGSVTQAADDVPPPPSARPIHSMTTTTTTTPTTTASTAAPTLVPTRPTTPAPSISKAQSSADPTTTTRQPRTISPLPPTAPPIPTDSTFRLKMYWQEGYYWQEEDFERKWCLECANCSNPLDGYYDPHGAYCYELEPSSTCDVGHQLWIRDCSGSSSKNGRREDRFAVTSVAGGWFHQIRVASSTLGTVAPGSGGSGGDTHNSDQELTATTTPTTDTNDNLEDGNGGLSVVSTTVALSSDPLCLERIGQRFVTLQRCNDTIFEQLWLPISFYGPFALLPADRVDICLTQQHHPKEYEPIAMSDCSDAKTTRFWQTYDIAD